MVVSRPFLLRGMVRQGIARSGIEKNKVGSGEVSQGAVKYFKVRYCKVLSGSVNYCKVLNNFEGFNIFRADLSQHHNFPSLRFLVIPNSIPIGI